MRKATKGRPQKRNITTRGGAEGPPLLVLRTGYMARYDGPDKITGGGAHVEEHGTGGEVFNFKPYRETCYGYAMSRHFAGLDLSKVDGRRLWEEGDELSGVDVVFIAKKGSAGQVVVGWYRDATVYHKQYQLRPSYFPATDEGRTGFFCKACFGTVILLPEKERTFKVPYAPAGHKGFPGKSHVWYPDKHIKERAVQSFVKKLRAYMDKKSNPSTRIPACHSQSTRRASELLNFPCQFPGIPLLASPSRTQQPSVFLAPIPASMCPPNFVA